MYPQGLGRSLKRRSLKSEGLDHQEEDDDRWQHLYVLPVLLLEFLALALTRAVLPELLLQRYGNSVYIVMGCADAVRGLLAFVACPLTGKISDVVGRRTCLFITVLGTCAPVCVLAFVSWDNRTVFHYPYGYNSGNNDPDPASVAAATEPDGASDEAGIWSMFDTDLSSAEYEKMSVHPHVITIFVALLSLSGIFSSTFTLVFAYISDTVRRQEERVSAYGLALATFGLSFTIGPMAGGYLSQINKQYVFLCSLSLTILDLLYIYLILPESRKFEQHYPSGGSVDGGSTGGGSLMTLDHNFSWNPWDSIRLVISDPFLRKVGQVAFLYYTGLWALISTMSVFAVKRFHLTPERLGELMSILGLCTMVAEAVLVRIMVPMLGEKKAMKVGLVAFSMQCAVLGFAYESWHLFVCAAFSLGANLVYPSLSSLVSGSVEPDAVGEALGAVNGVKALTEGIGPLFFGSLMTLSEHSALPGWPYLLAGLLGVFAYRAVGTLPDTDEDDYIHELDILKNGKRLAGQDNIDGNGKDDSEKVSLLNDTDDSFFTPENSEKESALNDPADSFFTPENKQAGGKHFSLR